MKKVKRIKNSCGKVPDGFRGAHGGGYRVKRPRKRGFGGKAEQFCLYKYNTTFDPGGRQVHQTKGKASRPLFADAITTAGRPGINGLHPAQTSASISAVY